MDEANNKLGGEAVDEIRNVEGRICGEKKSAWARMTAGDLTDTVGD